MTLDAHVETLMLAIEDYLEARDEYRTCVEGCEVSADYQCYHYREKYERASKRVTAALDEWFFSRLRSTVGGAAS